MSTLQVANVHFESTGANRIEYTGNNVVRVQGKGLVIPRIDTANTPSPEPGMMFYNTSTNNMVMMANTSAVVTIPSNTVVDAAFAKANAALANTSGTFAGPLTIKDTLNIYSDPLPNGKCVITSFGGGGLTRITSANTTAGGGIVAIGREPVAVHGMPAGYYSVELWSGANGGTQTVVAANGQLGIGVTPIVDKFVVKANTDLDFGVGYNIAVGNSVCLQAYNDARSLNVPMEIRASSFYFTIPTGNPLTIGANGMIGVGTTTPTSGLTIYTEGTNYTDGSYFLVTSTNSGFGGGGTFAGIKAPFSDGANASILRVQNASGTRFLIDGSGKVGVNQTTPAEMLSVTGNIRMQAANTRLIGFNNSGTYQLNLSGGGAILFNTLGDGSQEIAFETHYSGNSHAERMRIDKSGFVGIGTSTPSYKLDAYVASGDSSARFKSASGGCELLLDATNNFNSIRLFNSGTEKWRAGQVNSANYTIYDSPTGTSRLIIDTSGRVTKPYQPAFYANGAGGNYTLTNGADIVFGGTRFNTGNHYNTTNGRFTAPVAGVYCFHWSTYVTGATGRCSFKINGGDISGQQLEYSATQSQSMTVYLNAGDYVTVGDWQSISGGSLWLGHSQFSGHLVG